LVTSADENQSEFLSLQVHVIPMISEKPIAFVQLKKVTGVLLPPTVSLTKKTCFRRVISLDPSRRLGKSGLAVQWRLGNLPALSSNLIPA
jgi:hypothetical protein